MLRVDYQSALGYVESLKPRSVFVVAPDGLLGEARRLVEMLEAMGIEAIISGEACYGSCDLKEHAAEALKADLILHIGHTLRTSRLGRRTLLVAALDDVGFETVVEKAASMLRGYGRIGLSTVSQHLHRLPEVKKWFEERGFEVHIGEYDRFADGQILGCEFQTAHQIIDKVDAYIFLGQSRFHALGLALSTGKPTFMLDPYFNEVVDMQPLASDSWRRSVLAVYRAREAQSFGIIVGLREGQIGLHHARKIKAELERHGRSATIIAMREVTAERINTFTHFDAFIQTACPRITIDGLGFTKPVLSTPQAYALLNLLDGRDLDEFLVKPLWL